MGTLGTSLSIMKKNKNKEGVGRVSGGTHGGTRAVPMGTASGGRITRRVSARRQPKHPPTLRVSDYSKQSLDLIRLRLVEAVETLHYLPLTERDRPPKRIVSNMPPIVRQAWESYGWDRARAPRPTATKEQITRMEEAIDWLLWIKDINRRRAVWAMAHWLPRGRIARKMGCARWTVYRWEREGIMRIARRLKNSL